VTDDIPALDIAPDDRWFVVSCGAVAVVMLAVVWSLTLHYASADAAAFDRERGADAARAADVYLRCRIDAAAADRIKGHRPPSSLIAACG